MSDRTKKSDRHEYLQDVENRREDKRIGRTVLVILGRPDRFVESGAIDRFLRSGRRFTERFMLISTREGDRSGPEATVHVLGPTVISGHLCNDTGRQTAPFGSAAWCRARLPCPVRGLHRCLASGRGRRLQRERVAPGQAKRPMKLTSSISSTATRPCNGSVIGSTTTLQPLDPDRGGNLRTTRRVSASIPRQSTRTRSWTELGRFALTPSWPVRVPRSPARSYG